MLQKSLWFIGVALLVGVGFWLVQVMPFQAWCRWDGESWQVVGTGWGVLGRGWPLLALGALIGVAVVGALLASTLPQVQAMDLKWELERVCRQRDAAVAEADARVAERERLAGYREAAAFESQRVAEHAGREASAARQAAEQAVARANLRARNAIQAAERIKRRAAKSARRRK